MLNKNIITTLFITFMTLFSMSSLAATKPVINPNVFKNVIISEKLPFTLKLLHLDLIADNKELEEFIGLGEGVRYNLPIMGSIYYQGQCIIFMQEEGISSYYKKLGINNQTIDISVYHELGHCFTSKAKEDKQYEKLHSFTIDSEESAEKISNTKEYAQYVERFGDIYALSYIATHKKHKLNKSIKYLSKLRKIDATSTYDTLKGIYQFNKPIKFQSTVDQTAFGIMHTTY